ncbi:hypothetical protein I4U23_015569 [Adineta vaga]|nr:hypothetical protein I4U23_015569 [Adineta vaga]
MGNVECLGAKSNQRRQQKNIINQQILDKYSFIWLDDEQKRNSVVKYCLKRFTQQLIRFHDSNLCETFIRERSNYHFGLVVCHKLGNILVPEIDDLVQLDFVVIYNFSSTHVYTSWMKECKKIIYDVCVDVDQLEYSIKQFIQSLTLCEPESPADGNKSTRGIVPGISNNQRPSETKSTTNPVLDDSEPMYYLIWLDTNANNDKITKKELQSVIRCPLVIFDDVDECEKYVFNNSHARFIFIISYELGSVIVPKITSLKQNVSILVYSTSSISSNRPWTDDYFTDGRTVITDLTTLKTIVRYEFNKYGLETDDCNNPDNEIIMDVFNRKEMTTKNLKMEKGNFLWFRLFVEALINMEGHKRAHHDLLEILNKNYPYSNFVQEFSKSYAPDKVIEWLVRKDSCLIGALNKALRQQQLSHLFHFRCLINDIYQQLKTEHCKETGNKNQIIKVYRSHTVSEFELKKFQEANAGELIAINSFMTAWNDRTKAINFLKQQRQFGLKRILFEIKIDYRRKSGPFAHINVENQQLTLFMLGCIFRIQSILPDSILDHHILKLELCADDDSDLQTIFDYMTKDFVQPVTDLITLGNLLCRMDELDKARQFFELILTELEVNDPNRACCFDGLGNIEYDQGRYKQALEHHEQALQLRQNRELFPSNFSLIALSHTHIANDYKGLGKYDLALSNVEAARNLLKQRNLPEDRIKEAACHIIIGSILFEQEKCIEACDEFQEALKIYQQQKIPKDHIDLALIYQSMALCHLNTETRIHNANLALHFCIEAFLIRVNALPNNHPSMAITYRAMGLAYEQLDEYQLALEYFQKNLSVHRALNKSSSKLENAEADIKRIQKNLINRSSRSVRQFRSQKSHRDIVSQTGSEPKTTTESTKFYFKDILTQEFTRRIILLGRSDIVKSSFGNILLAQENLFTTNKSLSVTTSKHTSGCEAGFRDFHGKMLMIVDTPSLDVQNDFTYTLYGEIAESLELTAPGPHAFLFVLEFTPDLPVSEEDDQQLSKALVQIFGLDVFKYMVFVFTNLEKLQDAQISIEVYKKNYCSRTFIEMMDKCRNRIIPINSRTPAHARDPKFAEIILIIDRMLKDNDGKEYSYKSPFQQQTMVFQAYE